jgi:hypothetical protein
MIARALLLLAATAFAAASMNAGAGAARVGQDAATVEIPVSVREGSRVVEGLTAADLEVTDNEVPQVVEVRGLRELPFDVTLVIDLKSRPMNLAARLEKELLQVSRALRTGDRLRVLRVDTFVEELRPLSPVTGQMPQVSSRPNGFASLHDTLIAALIRPGEPQRVSLVVAVTDGIDSFSASTADRVREVAARSDAQLHVAAVRPSPAAVQSSRRPRFNDANVLVLAEAAEQTGGELRSPGLFGDADLVASFSRVMEDVGRSYLVSYTPSQVERAGWHEVVVAVPRVPNATVRARRGYYAN